VFLPAFFLSTSFGCHWNMDGQWKFKWLIMSWFWHWSFVATFVLALEYHILCCFIKTSKQTNSCLETWSVMATFSLCLDYVTVHYSSDCCSQSSSRFACRTSNMWSSYDRTWFPGPDKQEILTCFVPSSSAVPAALIACTKWVNLNFQ
jgi:hypothetical protein